jgi:peptide/nickel transport system permease protein
MKNTIYKKSQFNRFRFNLKHEKLALAALVVLIIIICICSLSHWLNPVDPNEQGDLLTMRYLKPSYKHWFGTDKFGRDIFSRVLYGGRISLVIAISVVTISLTIGLGYGTTAGYLGGTADWMMHFLDFWLAFPVIFLIIAMIAIFRPGTWFLVPLLSVTSWMETARIVRAEVLSLKSREFILAAQGLGLSHAQIIRRHIIPNCLPVVLVSVPLKIGQMILLESALSFLGIGVQPPVASWGSLINDGREVLYQAWWIATFPGLLIVLTVISFNLIGEGVRRSLGVK